MATLLNLRRRMKTASNVSKTTKAMQMIAASKLKKAQEAAESSKPYVEKLDAITKAIETKIDKDNLHKYMLTPKNQNAKLLVVISPDKGLCGGLVTNLLREVLHFSASGGKVYYITIGKKAEKAVASLNKDIIASFDFGTTLPQFESVFPLLKIIDEYFLGDKVSEVKILSTKFDSVFFQTPKFSTLLPVKLEEKIQEKSKTIFEPNVDSLLPSLLKHYLEMVIYQNLLESYASEQSSRMIAMKNATDNAIDIISELRLEYNKTRQEKITNELLDIGGGAQISV